jgi:peptidoglycan/xylan/chitin deacetylase (PgdA/CDA1 family)
VNLSLSNTGLFNKKTLIKTGQNLSLPIHLYLEYISYLWFNFQMTRFWWVTTVILLLFSSGCEGITGSQPSTIIPNSTQFPIPFFTQTSSPTLVPTSSPTPSPTLESIWTWNPSGEVIAPILLYHHVSNEEDKGIYNLTPEEFAAQMQALDDWGYTTITITQLIQALTEGAYLPERPIVITFDDGHLSVYENAFPIMQEHGFIGVTYVVGNYIGGENFKTAEQILELVDAGWEVGSHGFTHTDLSIDPTLANYEMYQSKIYLEELLGIPINTFSFPFGGFKPILGDRAWRYGYLGAVGLGTGWTHLDEARYYLRRNSILGSYDLETFASLLPWSAPE